ncbi:MFS transporter [Pontiella sulfatireligans]|uniref:Inner membrane symporter YicJ n=1 Tax=Pontiella sulfatireligans TaxID=2750658 RepID=A0A6C2UHC0_9BACT|nr:MFS transporter [Pontiella sulfatireligans]VGO19253.1 Inner membrane symporter YicJ [Pontiella sulfatireligans]
MKKNTLSFKEKFGYASGDFASCLYFGIFMNFMSYFYTDVFGISAAALATMIFITRTWDWINDPIMGVIADRTDTKMGKFRPWLLWMIAPYAVVGILTFTTFDLGATGKLVYAYVTYTLLTMIYTAINIPYSALMGVMTAKSSDRTVLASYRFVGAFAGTFFVNGTMLYLVSAFGRGNEKVGFTLTVALYALMAAGFFFLTFISTHERVKPPEGQKPSIVKDLQALRHNGPWITMIFVSVLTILWIAIRGGATIHYFKYVSGNANWGSLFLSISTVVQIVGVLLTRQIVALLGGKKRTFIIVNFVSGILIALFYFIDPKNIPLIMAHQVVSSFIMAPLMPLFWSMIADTADYGAWKLGQRSTGLLFSAGTFSQKIGWSIGPALSMALLGSFGFVANQDQSPETIHGLRLIMSLIPAVFAFLAGAAVFFYKIDATMEKEMETAMAAEEL